MRDYDQTSSTGDFWARRRAQQSAPRGRGRREIVEAMKALRANY